MVESRFEASRSSPVRLPLVSGSREGHRPGGAVGLLGGAAAWAIVALAIHLLNRELAAFGNLFGLSPRLGFMPVGQSGILLAISGLLGWLGAWMSVSRHLWKMDPK